MSRALARRELDRGDRASFVTTSELGLPAIAYLRSLAEGVSMADAAKRYLDASAPNQARKAHRAIVEHVRTLARRRGDPAWRLIGVELGAAAAARPNVPSLSEWAEQEGLEGWRESELLELYKERFAARLGAASARHRSRNARLRERRLELLRELERAAADQTPQPSDFIAGWIDPTTAERLKEAGALTLEDLQRWISSGRRWWYSIPAIGDIKAKALTRKIERLIGTGRALTLDWVRLSDSGHHDGRAGMNRQLQVRPAIDASSDRAAIAAWVAARQGSPRTETRYTREGTRFLLWCLVERRKALSDASVEDCRAFMAFLAKVPENWISARRVEPFAPGWAPFAGQLSRSSQQQTVTILHAMFSWLVDARYLLTNPWTLVNRKLGDEVHARSMSTKAFTPEAWQALLDELERAPQTRTTARLKWLCTLMECTGLRSAELLAATRGDIETTRAGALLHVLGKGKKHREVPLPTRALEATKTYFTERGLDFDGAAAETPLLAALEEPTRAISYASLYETFTRFMRRALVASDLDEAAKSQAQKASLHWLRHTHATRFAERGGDLDVLQANLGHADPRTAAVYFRAQIERRQKQAEKAFG